jgi:TrmH family RNA methyltransferase
LSAFPPYSELRVVLVAARNPLNIGAAARAMSNFGFRYLRVVNPYDVAFREARSAMGAAQLLAQAEEYKSIGDAIADCNLVIGTTAIRHRELQHPLRLLKDGAKLIRGQIASERIALLFGSEKFGLSNQDLSHCHWLMHIPTQDRHVSMNLGQAVAVSLYEISRGWKKSPRQKKTVRAHSAEVERVTSLLLTALRNSGYIQPLTAVSSEDKIRRLVRRLDLQKEDAELWLGMLRQMVWKMRNHETPTQK